MQIIIDDQLRALLKPLEPEEYQQLEQSILDEGCRDALVLWGDIVIDGHNRYEICTRHGIKFETSQKHFDSYDDAKIWMIDNQLARRNLSDGWRLEYALNKKELLLKVGREKYLTTVGRPNKLLSFNDNNLEGESKHNTQKDIALSLNWSTGKVAQAEVVRKEAQDTWQDVLDGKKTIGGAYQAVKTKGKKKQIKQEVKSRVIDSDIPPTVYHKNAIDFLASINDKSVDLLFTDPPYITDVEDIDIFISSWVYSALSKIKETGRAYICTGAYPNEQIAYLLAFKSTDFIVDAPIIWTYKNTLGNTPKMKYNLNYQVIHHLYRKTSTKLNTGISNEMFSVQNINAPDGRIGNRFYKWQKPNELCERLINHSTSPGDSIIDPFAGSGAILLAASKLGRVATGSEINQEAIDIMVEFGVKVEL